MTNSFLRKIKDENEHKKGNPMLEAHLKEGKRKLSMKQFDLFKNREKKLDNRKIFC